MNCISEFYAMASHYSIMVKASFATSKSKKNPLFYMDATTESGQKQFAITENNGKGGATTGDSEYVSFCVYNKETKDLNIVLSFTPDQPTGDTPDLISKQK